MSGKRREEWQNNRYSGSPQSVKPSSGRKTPPGPAVLALRWLILAVAAGVLLFQVGYVRGIRVEGAVSSEEAAYMERAAMDMLNAFSRLKWLVPARAIETAVAAEGGMESARVHVSFLSSQLRVTVTPYEPLARLKTDDSRPLGISSKGVLFTLPQQDTALPLIEDTLQVAVTAGRQVMSPQAIAFVAEFEAGLDQAARTRRHYRIGSEPRQVELIDASRGYSVKLASNRSAADQLDELKETEQHLKSRRQTPRSYIDLRIDNTAYYR